MSALAGVLLQRLEAVGCVDESLARDAASNQTGSTRFVPFDDYRIEA